MNVEISQHRSGLGDSIGGSGFAVCEPLLRWFLILTKSCGEGTAKLNLERQGYRVYYPRLLRPSLYRGRRIDRIVSLFPRYLFIQLDTSQQSLAPVRSTLGVASIVCFGSQTAIVHDAIVDGLMRRADPDSGLHRLNGATLEPGMAVRVISGPLAGLEGVFEREVGDERVIVLLRLLGRETPVCIAAAGFAVP